MSTHHRSFFLALLLPAFLLVGAFAVVRAQTAGSPAASRWSDPATWPDRKVPTRDDVVTITKDMHVILDVSPPPLHGIKLDGTLSFADDG
ncbi:MAG: G8 domain-containing protein [Deltaproteobacteria bacterium]